MSAGAPIALVTLAKFAAGLGALVVVAYILKLRRRKYEVPFSKLWQRVLREREATTLWRKLKRIVSLAVQLTVLALLLGAVADPRLGAAQTSGRHMVVLVDASASMKALDDDDDEHGPARINEAKLHARALIKRMGGADWAMVMRVDGQPAAMTRFESDVPRLLKTIDAIEPTDTPADLRRALQAAADALRGRRDPLMVIIGDGGYRDEALNAVIWSQDVGRIDAIDLSGIEVTFVPVGRAQRNVGIVAFNVRRYFQNKLAYEVLVELENFGVKPETARFTLYSGEEPIDVKTIDLEPGERIRQIYPDLGGGDDRKLMGRVEVTPTDALPTDDVAYALLPERHRQRVLLVTEDNLYLEGALLLDPGITVDKIRPEEWARHDKTGYDAAVFDGFTPPEGLPPMEAALYFRPSGESSPFKIRTTISRPFVTDVDQTHPVTRWIALSDVNIDSANVLLPDQDDVVLARSIRDPLALAGRREGKKVVAVGWGLDGTDLVLRVAFPVLIMNTLDWFAGDDAELNTTYRTGRAWHIPMDPTGQVSSVTVVDPKRERTTAPVLDGRASFYGRHVGIYTITSGEDTLTLAANLGDPVESRIAPRPELMLGGRKLGAPPELKVTATRTAWVWLVLVALGVVTLEWLTYHRRITV